MRRWAALLLGLLLATSAAAQTSTSSTTSSQGGGGSSGGAGGGSDGDLASTGGTGLVAETATGVTAARTITNTDGCLTVQNGDGVSADPIVNVDSNCVPTFSSGTADPPATCTPPELYYETDTFELSLCSNTDTWEFMITMNAQTDDATIVGSGTGFALKVIPDCNSASNALNYDTATNAWSCATITASGGAGLRTQPAMLSDMMQCVTTGNWYEGLAHTAITTGTCAAAAVDGGAHQGIQAWTSSGSANSGWQARTSGAVMTFGGGETYEIGFRITTLSTLTWRLGFMDTTSSTAPTDGCYITVVSTGVATGTCSNNTSNDDTNTTTTLSTATWYRAVIAANSDATSVAFTIYLADGTQVWTDSVTTQIPTTAARAFGYGAIATQGTGGTTALVDVDYILYYSTKVLAR